MSRPDSSDIGERPDAAAELRRQAEGISLERTLVLVGLMGAGKTTVGRRLAAALGVPFRDADEEIVRAAGMSIDDIFAQQGECEFRRGERRVIARLIKEPPHVLATGGGAFIDPSTRALLNAEALTVWLRAPLEVLMRRVARRNDRPLLKEDDPEAVMRRLMEVRYPLYAEAHLTIDSGNGPHNSAVADVLAAIHERQAKA
ncbi:shikimate kinase I [alpha proteobacterium U9-1i]|nr:shikimate kinase I [alpha proteobacterium U9-1i]